MIGYDKIPEHEGTLLDLPFYEGIGTITRDQAKPHHQDVLLINTPTWESLESEFDFGFDSGFDFGVPLGVLSFNNVSQEYIELDDASCVDLDFIAGDYSIGEWIRWEDTSTSLNIMGRYELNVSGWEHYLFRAGGPIDYLTTRHHHAGTLVGANARSGCYSAGWLPDIWWFMGISRFGGGEAFHCRNGIALTMATGGLVDPETCNQDLTIGTRWQKNGDFYKGKRYRLRIWNRALAASEWLQIFEKERRFFGV